jgi:hypothetical protein
VIKDTYKVFCNLRMKTKKRGIPFGITIHEFRVIWGDQFAVREQQGLQLQRIDKTVGYTIGNLRIDTLQPVSAR